MIYQKKGQKKFVYIDESGFESNVSCRYGYSKQGKKLIAERKGSKRARENLIAGRQGGKLIAPMIVSGSVNATCFELWMEQCLLPEIAPESVLIMDNAPIHRKNKIRELAEAQGHQVLFLPKYSPDFNDIEHDFSALKRRREFAPDGIAIAKAIDT